MKKEGVDMYIAVVDDSADICKVLRFVLERGARQVRTFESAPQALQSVLAGEAYAVLTDIHMPGMDGLELLEQVKLKRPEVPVYLMSGKAGKTPVELSQRGAAGFFEKPVDFGKILATFLPSRNSQ